MELRLSFTDKLEWKALAEKHLDSYSLPKWSTRCDPEAMHKWLDRLHFEDGDYERVTKTTVEDFIQLNPPWPLRAFIGLACEMREDRK